MAPVDSPLPAGRRAGPQDTPAVAAVLLDNLPVVEAAPLDTPPVDGRAAPLHSPPVEEGRPGTLRGEAGPRHSRLVAAVPLDSRAAVVRLGRGVLALITGVKNNNK